jgi:hypothetical protein
MGFARGQIRCSDACRLDWSACGVCGADPHIDDCLRVDGTYWADTTQDLAVESNGTRAAITWVERSNTGSLGRLHFALVNDDLTLAASDCFAEEGENWRPHLAAVPDGWILAYTTATLSGGDNTIRTILLDATGQAVSTSVPIAGVGIMDLIARPDGGPLLLYGSAAPDGTSAFMAALLDGQGRVQWTSRIADGAQIADTTAVYTGDGFLWVSRNSLVTDQVVARIDLSGTISTSTLALPQTFVFPSLAWTGTEARLFWNGSWMALDKQGAALGGVRQILLTGQPSQPQSVAIGETTATLLRVGQADRVLGGLYGSGTSTGHPELVIVDAQGGVTGPIAVFQNGNQGPNFMHHLVAVGERWLASALTADARIGFQLYLAWVRP